MGLNSEPSSVTSSSSTHRTSASLGSNIAPGTSITSSSSSTGGTSTTAGQSASPPTEDQERLDNLNKKMGRLTSEAMSQHQCMVSFTPIQITVNTRESPVSGKQSPVDSGSKSTNTNTGPASILAPLPKGQGYNVFMSGSYHQVMAARSYLQREMPFDRQCLVVVPTVEVVDSLNKLKPEMSKKLDDIAALTSAQLEVRRHTPATRSGFSMDADRNVDISIKGSHESVEQARVRILVMLDELVSVDYCFPKLFRSLTETFQNGLHTEVFEIDYKYHNMMAGRRRERIQRIQEETSCSIYFPSPFSGIHDGLSDYLAIARASLVFISGDFYNVKRAKDMLAQDVFARVGPECARKSSAWLTPIFTGDHPAPL